MSDLSPGISKFLAKFEKTNGFGLAWRIYSGSLRANANCCPLTAQTREDACMWEAVAEAEYGLPYEESLVIANSADSPTYNPAIRARLLNAVGLKEAE